MTRTRWRSISFSSPFLFFPRCKFAAAVDARRDHAVRLFRLQRAVRARFVDDLGQVLRQQFERLVDRQPEMPGKFLNLSAAEDGLELLFGDRKIGARAEP